MRKLILAGSALMLFATACNNSETYEAGPNKTLSQKDQSFMVNATYSNIGEVETGNIARQRAMDAAVTNFGSMMVSDHGKAHNELQDIAQDVSYILPTATDKEHKDMAAMLMNLSGRVFDSTYMYMMVAGHDKAIALFQDEVANGQNPTVKSYAADKLPTLTHHRHMADSIARTLFPR